MELDVLLNGEVAGTLSYTASTHLCLPLQPGLAVAQGSLRPRPDTAA
jgi:hypothetical protein